MSTHSDTRTPEQHSQRHLHLSALLVHIGRVLFVAVLFLLFFLLAQSMAHHRFFEGGWYNQNGTIRP